MSLDVYLELNQPVSQPGGSGIFVRENGSNREISREEWDRRFPGCEPVVLQRGPRDDGEAFHANITHNLNTMADAAGLYRCLWRPEELGISRASQLIAPLREGLDRLRSAPDLFKVHNPENGWGDYDGLVAFVADYLAACERYPDADVTASR